MVVTRVVALVLGSDEGSDGESSSEVVGTGCEVDGSAEVVGTSTGVDGLVDPGSSPGRGIRTTSCTPFSNGKPPRDALLAST